MPAHQLPVMPSAGDMQFAGCVAMQGPGNTCLECDAQCGISNHYHARKKVEKVALFFVNGM